MSFGVKILAIVVLDIGCRPCAWPFQNVLLPLPDHHGCPVVVEITISQTNFAATASAPAVAAALHLWSSRMGADEPFEAEARDATQRSGEQTMSVTVETYLLATATASVGRPVVPLFSREQTLQLQPEHPEHVLAGHVPVTGRNPLEAQGFV